MYRLIFVDDEDIVREGIRTRVPWGKNGFELAGTFENGVEALSYMARERVDLVLSDISMPRMDGLTLSQRIAEEFPGTQVLLLTGFEEFEYARRAVRHRVREFLLKPMTAEELGEVLERTRLDLDEARRYEKEQERLRSLLNDSLPLLRQRFFYRLISGKLDAEDIERRREFFDWPDLGGFSLVVVAAQPDDWDELTRFGFTRIVQGMISRRDGLYFNRSEDPVLLLQGKDASELEKRGKKIAEALFNEAMKMGDSPVTIGIGEVVSGVEDANRSYLGAGNAVDHGRILGIARVQSIHEVRQKSRVSQEAFVSRARHLEKALKEGTRDSAREALDSLFALFEESYLTSSDAAGYLSRLQYHLSDFAEDMGFAGEDGGAAFPLLEPGVFSRLEEAKVYFRKQVAVLESRIRLRRNDAAHSRIDKALRLIAERFRDKNLGLRDICSELYLSTSQFSVLFKEATGRTFVEYLTEMRVDEAKKLLKTTDLRSYEVADAVGYQDPRYFSSIFKKTTGLTTTEYRRETGD